MPFKDSLKKKLYQHDWYLKHREEVSKRGAEWRKNNRLKKRLLNLAWSRKNKEKARKSIQNWEARHIDRKRELCKLWMRKKRTNDFKFRLDLGMGRSIYQALKGNKNGRSWEKIVDFSLEDLISHLESKFDKNMTWNNYGSFWVIDHIKPKSLFHYNTAEAIEFKQCWGLSNLQPLEKIANLKKGNHFKENAY